MSSKEVSSPASGAKRRRRDYDDSSHLDDSERPNRRARNDAEIEEEEEGEDLFDNMEADYREMGVLDAYDSAMLDDRDYGPMDADERAAAEAAIRERDRREGRFRTSRLQTALESDEEEEDSAVGFRDRRRRRALEQAALSEGEEEMDEPFNLETFQVPLREWVTRDQTRNEIKRRFRDFLETYTAANGERIHEKVIDEMCADSATSLVVSYLHLSHHSPILAIWLADVPKQMLELFDEVAREVVLKRYPDYWRITDEIHVRIQQLPIIDSLRDLRHVHLNAFVKVAGVVTRRTGVFPMLKKIHYNCTKCGCDVGPFFQTDDDESRKQIGSCPECQSSGPFILNHEHTLYRNFQRITLQESPGSVPPGRVPRYKEIFLRGDLIDVARPGEEVEVTGIYIHQFDPSLNVKQGFPVFSTILEANYIEAKNDASAALLVTEEDRREIAELAKSPKLLQRIIKSIAPSIYGHDHIKLAIALSMFGGREKNVNMKHRIRGDINVLMLGDPGVAKSQFLKYIEKTAPRAVYTTGKGASAVGLTAAVHKDPVTREWTLEGGALVLADRGICLIDEFDKMNDADRTSIHEAMEQQSISISKAGIVTTLQARCAVIAAANPVGGRYDITKTFSENVQLTDPILTRFDILCVVRDEADPALDEKLATFVVESHSKAHPAARAAAADAALRGEAPAAGLEELNSSPEIAPIPQALLKKYVLLAKEVKPSLSSIDQDKLAKLYSDLRKESEISGGIPIAVRHIESMMRMSEASARMRLSPVVNDSDVTIAIRVMLESFISAQRFSVMRVLRRQFSKYLDAGADYNQLCLVKLRDLVRERQALEYVRSSKYEFDPDALGMIEIKETELREKARRHGIDDSKLAQFLCSRVLEDSGFTYDKARRVIYRVL